VEINSRGNIQAFFKNQQLVALHSHELVSQEAKPILRENTWTHIAVVYNSKAHPFDSGLGLIQFYVNGELEQVLSVGGYIQSSKFDLFIGKSILQTNNTYQGLKFTPVFFAGHLSEMRIWGTARTAQEIKSYFTVRLSGKEAGLVSYWPLNEGLGNTLKDLKGGANAVLTGGHWVPPVTPLAFAEIVGAPSSSSNITSAPRPSKSNEENI